MDDTYGKRLAAQIVTGSQPVDQTSTYRLLLLTDPVTKGTYAAKPGETIGTAFDRFMKRFAQGE